MNPEALGLGSRPRTPNNLQVLLISSRTGRGPYEVIGSVCELLHRTNRRISIIPFHPTEQLMILPLKMREHVAQIRERGLHQNQVIIIPDCATREQFDSLPCAVRVRFEGSLEGGRIYYKKSDEDLNQLAQARAFDQVFDVEHIKTEVIAKEIVSRWLKL